MKTAEYKTNTGLVFKHEVPSSVEEFDQNAKKAGACLEEATNNVVYRSSLAEFRASMCEKLEEKYKEPRKTKVSGKNKAGEDIVVFAETENDYIERVAALQKVEVTSFQALADEVSKSISFDASATVRKGGPIKLGKFWLELGAQAIAKGVENTKFAKGWHKMFGVAFPKPTLSEKKEDAESNNLAVARLIKQYDDKLHEQTAAASL